MVRLTKTFLLTDVEKSTQLSEQHGGAIDPVRNAMSSSSARQWKPTVAASIKRSVTAHNPHLTAHQTPSRPLSRRS